MLQNTPQLSTPTPTNRITTMLPCTSLPSPKQFNQLAVATLREIITARERLIKLGKSKVHLYRNNREAITIFKAYKWNDPQKTARWILKHEQDFREIIPGKNYKLQAQFDEVIQLANTFKPIENEN